MAEPVSSSFAPEILKWVWGVITSIVGFLAMWIFKKQANTYTKEETEKLIDLKISPLVASLDNYSTSVVEQTKTLSELNKTLQSLDKNLAVTQTKVEIIEDWKSRH